jgi:hypothetical protein
MNVTVSGKLLTRDYGILPKNTIYPPLRIAEISTIARRFFFCQKQKNSPPPASAVKESYQIFLVTVQAPE